ncbi:PQQ-dependent sugar dehydrogenase [Aquihabitans sp. G128]|uniref:PQQ-dependent sugar dehydrogenase n=1 Tax=Aquihabitans sp. G128 TaxID=2849779 RepID=UPI001C24858F|nr:PQQ-dependent sugar dehydrogenase [Aquihabitans sp. G128]QXC63399.1 PQQ-dependent sugar dehydrogenase [Aquihabitans sp. G128]
MTHLGPRPRRLLAGTALVAALALAGAACGSGESTSGAPSSTQAGKTSSTTSTDGGSGTGTSTGDPKVESTTALAADAPIDLVVRPGDDDLWLAERGGKVRRVRPSDDGAKLATEGEPVLDLSDQTTTDSERGLLGLAFSAKGDVLYVSYTDLEGDTRLVSYAVDGDAVDEGSRKVLLAVDQPFSNHNGGHVVLGPDGKLWFGLGDGGDGDDPGNRAQDPDTFLGKMLRIDPAGGDPEVVISGLRNPWRFSFDADGSLWIGDVGQNQWEEIDHLAADDIEGTNLGWSGREGTHENANVDPEGRTGTDPVDPVFDYSHDGGNCSITGGFAYHGKAIPELVGAYVYADYCKGDVRAIRLGDDGTLAAEYDLGLHVDSPVSFAVDADGEPYVLSGGGNVERIIPAG